MTVDISSLLASHRKPTTPEGIAAALDDMCTPGFNWEMFTARGNAACATALAAVVADGTVAAREDLLRALDAQLGVIWAAGHHEVGDTEPLSLFADAAALICMQRGWPAIEYAEVGTRLGEAERLADQARQAAERAATAALVANHKSEWDRLVQSHLNN